MLDCKVLICLRKHTIAVSTFVTECILNASKVIYLYINKIKFKDYRLCLWSWEPENIKERLPNFALISALAHTHLNLILLFFLSLSGDLSLSFTD